MEGLDAAIKMCFQKWCFIGMLMWFIWKMDEHRLNITPLKGCFSRFFLIKDRLNVQSCTLKLQINNRLSD